MNISILIPAYNPDEKLLSLVKTLTNMPFMNILVVNDGSKQDCQNIFDSIKNYSKCSVIHHEKNMGKGRALKTGLQYIKDNFPTNKGIVTVDADGQHLPKDILNVAETLELNNENLVLGSRQFTKEIPFRSFFGNKLTQVLFSLLIGEKVTDTQTGLRGIPYHLIDDFLAIKGERYEYEINMLIQSVRSGHSIIEKQIETVYIENNKSSHFNPLVDSMKIYLVLFRFASSSLITSIVDFIIFTIVYAFFSSILFSFIAARFFASILNYNLNKGIVFKSDKKGKSSIVRYYILLIALSTVAYLGTNTLASMGANVLVSKIAIESIIFIASFIIQKHFIFNNNKSSKALNRNNESMKF